MDGGNAGAMMPPLREGVKLTLSRETATVLLSPFPDLV